ncbi:MAG: type III polyketide synthase [Thermoanaerobaculia bacterium]|nr:type III polyketide synthase [Thermoanaerobaculia bacterium]
MRSLDSAAAAAPRVAAVGAAFPPHYYDQETLLAALRTHWQARYFNLDRLEQLHRNVRVGGRHLALPLEQYAALAGFGDANAAWIRVATEVGEAALADGLARAGLSAGDVSALFFTSVTGIATPSIDARLMNRLALPAAMKRVPIFGLGCVAGAAGIARAADYLLAYPDEVAVLLSVELCSLTLQSGDLSIPNLIASGLFGDGGAAAIVVGARRAAALERVGPAIVATRSVFYRDSERVMGWDIQSTGFQIVLSAEVPQVVERHLRADVDALLAEHNLARADIASWICHPGGPKVLEAMQAALEVPRDALALTWKSLEEVGNLSSTSVLLVLQETMAAAAPSPGAFGMLLALGPGFCSELVLLRW